MMELIYRARKKGKTHDIIVKACHDVIHGKEVFIIVPNHNHIPFIQREINSSLIDLIAGCTSTLLEQLKKHIHPITMGNAKNFMIGFASPAVYIDNADLILSQEIGFKKIDAMSINKDEGITFWEDHNG